MKLFIDGGFWMYPVALVGLVGIVSAVVNAFTRGSKSEWAIAFVSLTLVLGMIGAFFSMSFALEYIAVGQRGKIWIPMVMSALGLLPIYFACSLAAIGSGLLGLSSAYRNRIKRRKALCCLADGLAACCVLVCFSILTNVVSEMLKASIDFEDKNTGMAFGLATSVQNVIWPATIAMLLLLARMIELVTRRSTP